MEGLKFDSTIPDNFEKTSDSKSEVVLNKPISDNYIFNRLLTAMAVDVIEFQKAITQFTKDSEKGGIP